jgi:hypothetical protein
MIETIEIKCSIRHSIGPSAFFQSIVIWSNDRLNFKQIKVLIEHPIDLSELV